jgi:periplasmic divalent cation tolerance protein
MNSIFIYITNPNKNQAQKIAKHLLKERLIACANIFPIESLYWWQGKITADNEYVLIAKTTEANFKKVQKTVEKIHPYKIPCIIKIPITPNQKFSHWLKNEVK